MTSLSMSVSAPRIQINLNEASWFELCGTCTFKVLMNQNQQHRKVFFLGSLEGQKKNGLTQSYSPRKLTSGDTEGCMSRKHVFNHLPIQAPNSGN